MQDEYNQFSTGHKVGVCIGRGGVGGCVEGAGVVESSLFYQ